MSPLAPLAVPILAVVASYGARSPAGLNRVARLAGVALEAVALGAAWLAVTGAAPWDGFSTWYLLLVASLGGLGCFVSVHYVLAEGDWTPAQVRRYFLLLHAFVGSLLAVAVAGNLLLLWGAVEATTVTSALLVAADGTRRATEAGWKYLIVTSVGSLLALVGLVVLLAATGQPLAAWGFAAQVSAHPGPPGAVLLGTWLVVVGFATKAGLAPFHTWLPDAHAEAPAPISALLSGVELAGAMYALLRALQVTAAAIGPLWPRDLLIGLGLLSLALAAAAMAGQRDMKRLFAYSSIEHMGVVALGMGFGGVALVGALLHVWAHGLAKSGLFYGAGGVKLQYASTGILRSLPLTGAGIAACAVAITGLPPFGLFFSEWLVLLGGARAGQVAAVVIAACLLAAGLIALAVRLPDFLFGSAPVAARRERLAAVWPLAAVVVASLLVGPAGLVLLRGLSHGPAQLAVLGWPRP